MDEEKIIEKLIIIEGKVEKTVTKEEFNGFKEDYYRGQDKMITILERLDQERVFTNEKIKQLESEINQIKTHLQIA